MVEELDFRSWELGVRTVLKRCASIRFWILIHWFHRFRIVVNCWGCHSGHREHRDHYRNGAKNAKQTEPAPLRNNAIWFRPRSRRWKPAAVRARSKMQHLGTAGAYLVYTPPGSLIMDHWSLRFPRLPLVKQKGLPDPRPNATKKSLSTDCRD